MSTCCTGGAHAAGCGGIPTKTAHDKQIAERLVSRWQGAVVDPPAGTWFENGKWDVWFSPDGDFSALIYYYGPEKRRDLHLQGKIRLSYGTLYIDEPSLSGPWIVVSPDADHVILKQREVTIAQAFAGQVRRRVRNTVSEIDDNQDEAVKDLADHAFAEEKFAWDTL